METTKFKCNFCAKTYTRKSFYDRHVLCCELLNSSKNDRNNLINENEQPPSIHQLYSIIKELNYNYLNLKSELDNMKKHVYKTKKPKYLLDCLNEKDVELINIYDYIDNQDINISSIQTRELDKNINFMFNKQESIPICCFEQNKNELFIFKNKWELCSHEEFKTIVDIIHRKILRIISQHEVSENNYCHLLKNLITQKTNYSYVKKKLFHHLKTTVTNIIEYEFH